MKKSLALLLVLIVVLSVAGVVIATGGFQLTTVITPASTSATPIVVVQGQTVLLTATTTSSSGNVTFVSENWNGATVSAPASGTGSILVSQANFSSNILGLHTVTYTITVSRAAGLPKATSDAEAYLLVEEETTVVIPVIVEPMAAPAVAAQILKFNQVQPRYGQGRTGGNFIADVAHKMGPQTMFNGVPKEVWSEGANAFVSNPDYWAKVLAFLNAHPRKPKTFTCAYDWFVDSLE